MKKLIIVAAMAVCLVGFSGAVEAAKHTVVVKETTQVVQTGKHTFKSTTKKVVTGPNGKQKKTTIKSTITTK